MKSLNVLFITSTYPTAEKPVRGVFIREHAKAAQLYDNVVVLHCAGDGPFLENWWRIEREHDKDLTEGVPTYRVWYRRSPFPKTSYFVYLFSVFQAVRQIIKEDFVPDLIHAHIYKAGVPAVILGKLWCIPVLVSEHFSVFLRRTLTRIEFMKAFFAFAFADCVLPVSRTLQASIEVYGLKGCFKVVPNVVDTNIFYPKATSTLQNHRKRLLFVGLLNASHIKGIPYLLKALAKLKQKRDDWHLDIVGDGPARDRYEQDVDKLGIADKVDFHGLKTKQEIASLMRKTDLFVVSSLHETFSAVTVEALATGTPVLATQCGGPEEIITEDVGLLVPSRDVNALYNGLVYMLNNLNKYSSNQISDYAKKLYGQEAVGLQIHNIYRKLI